MYTDGRRLAEDKLTIIAFPQRAAATAVDASAPLNTHTHILASQPQLEAATALTFEIGKSTSVACFVAPYR